MAHPRQWCRSAAALIIASVSSAGAATARAQLVTVDNLDPGFTLLFGTWNTDSDAQTWGSDYRWASGAPLPTAQVEWRPGLSAAGEYLVEIWYSSGADRSSSAPFTVHHVGGTTIIPVNQQINGGQWFSIGTFSFNSGTGGDVTLSNNAGGGVVVADAVRFSLVDGVTEFRGMWATRFEWPSTSRTAVQNKIIEITDKLQANNFNAVLFQVRGQADTLYPSPFEPWSPLVSSDGETPTGWGSFDPLDYAITQAHARGLELHAYINTHTCWQSGAGLPPTYNLDHVFWDHCNASDPAARDWLVHNESGTPVQFEESDYVWIAPGVPDAQAYTRQQVMVVVENYDVDGVHFDRIRTPGTEYSHDPISEARQFGEGNPDGLGFEDWTRDQITRMLRDLYAQIMEVKPQVKVSSAPVGLYRADRYPGYPSGPCGFFYGYSCVYQDAQAWIAAGAQDFLVPQIYWADGGGNPDFSEVLPDWLAHDAGRHIYAGQLRSVGVTELISQIDVTRTMGGEGNVVFSFSSFDSQGYWDEYSDPGGPYEESVSVPDMPWKSSPTQGVIIGTVTEADGVSPIVDAHVTRTGSSYTALTSGDGLYSFLLVDPGAYELTFDKAGVGSRLVCSVTVQAGEVTRVDTTLGGPFISGDYDGDGDVDLMDHGPFADCIQGPGVTYPAGHCCLAGDGDADLDVDFADFAEIQPLLGQ